MDCIKNKIDQTDVIDKDLEVKSFEDIKRAVFKQECVIAKNITVRDLDKIPYEIKISIPVKSKLTKTLYYLFENLVDDNCSYTVTKLLEVDSKLFNNLKKYSELNDRPESFAFILLGFIEYSFKYHIYDEKDYFVSDDDKNNQIKNLIEEFNDNSIKKTKNLIDNNYSFENRKVIKLLDVNEHDVFIDLYRKIIQPNG